MENCLAVILGGGQGSRLYPLTRMRSKPAVPLGGRYRLIDIPLSNCINSKLNRIFVLTQFNSESLNRHVSQTYKFDDFRGGFVVIMAAEQTPSRTEWFQGTADAVRRNLGHFTSYPADYYLILAGDHLYRMDYRKFIQAHIQTKADITVGVHPVDESQAAGFGILKINLKKQIIDFVEKPQRREELEPLRIPRKGRTKRAQRQPASGQKDLLASMGIYVFSREVLHTCLKNEKLIDFGRHIIPSSIGKYRVIAYPFSDYWEDIGTIRSFYEANLAMAEPEPLFQFQTEEGPIYTHPRFLPPARVEACTIKRSLITEGSVLSDCTLEQCVIGVRSTIRRGSTLQRVVMMGADFYESAGELRANRRKGIPDVGIGPGCVIRGAIIDKNARIGNGVTIENPKGLEHADAKGYAIRDGIVVIAKNAVIPDGTAL